MGSGSGQAPEVEARILGELDELGLLATAEHPAPRPIEWEDTSRLRYLNCVIKAGILGLLYMYSRGVSE